MRKLTHRFIEWCKEDTAEARFERSIFQAVIGLIGAGVSAWADAPLWFTVGIAPVIMAVLAPIMKAAANKGEVD